MVPLTHYPMNNYEHISHTHCWKQKPPSACGIPPEKHTQCCLCDLPWPQPTHEIGWERGLLLWDKEEFIRTDEDAEKYTGFQCSVWVFKGDVDEFIRKTLTHQQKRIIEKLEGMRVPSLGWKDRPFYGTVAAQKAALQYNQAIEDAIEAVKNAS